MPEDDEADGRLSVKSQPRECAADGIDRGLLLHVHRAATWRISRRADIGRWKAGAVGVVGPVAEGATGGSVARHSLIHREVLPSGLESDRRTAADLGRTVRQVRSKVRETVQTTTVRSEKSHLDRHRAREAVEVSLRDGAGMLAVDPVEHLEGLAEASVLRVLLLSALKSQAKLSEKISNSQADVKIACVLTKRIVPPFDPPVRLSLSHVPQVCHAKRIQSGP